MNPQDAPPTALEQFLRYEADLKRFINSQLSCKGTSEDLAQETWLRFSRIRNTEHIVDIKAFLFRIAGNLTIDHLRKSRQENHHSVLSPEAEAPSAERVVSGQQQCDSLYQAIAELPLQCRVAFTLHRLKGKRYSEIAVILGISEKAVEKHISKALQHCRHRVRPQ